MQTAEFTKSAQTKKKKKTGVNIYQEDAETGRRGDGEKGRRGEGETGRRGGRVARPFSRSKFESPAFRHGVSPRPLVWCVAASSSIPLIFSLVLVPLRFVKKIHNRNFIHFKRTWHLGKFHIRRLNHWRQKPSHLNLFL